MATLLASKMTQISQRKTSGTVVGRRFVGPRFAVAILFLLLPPVTSRSGFSEPVHTPSGQKSCRKVVLTGAAAAGQEWSTAIGEGWLFRVVPIGHSAQSSYSGWDLVVDRAVGGGYPDALLLATPPYGSLKEREIGTTYGMRAQDAIAWEPRRFHFFTNVQQWKRARELFAQLMPASAANKSGPSVTMRDKLAGELLRLISSSPGLGSGELSVLDAKLSGGLADPPAYAQQWALHLGQVPYTMENKGRSPSHLGELLWFCFSVTLLLPSRWRLPESVPSQPANCAQ